MWGMVVEEKGCVPPALQAAPSPERPKQTDPTGSPMQRTVPWTSMARALCGPEASGGAGTARLPTG